LTLFEIDLVLDAGDGSAFATVKLPLIPKVGQDIHFEAKPTDSAASGSFRVTRVGYHVRARKLTGQTGDLFGISLTVEPINR
jgi:hypothetical protein